MTDNTERDALARVIAARPAGDDSVPWDIDYEAADAVLAWMRENEYEKRKQWTGAKWDYAALTDEAERLYERAVAHDDVDYEVGLIQRLGLALHEAAEREPVVVDDAMVDRGWHAINAWIPRTQVRRILTAALTPDGQGEKAPRDWDRVHDRPADIYTPPEDCVTRPAAPDGQETDSPCPS